MRIIAFLIYPLLAFADSYYIHDADIYNHPSASVILIEDDTITCIGNPLSCNKPQNAIMLDANGKHLYPGFIDSHTHIAYSALLKHAGLDLSAIKGKENILDAIARYAKTNPKQKRIFGFGVFPYVMGRNGPNRAQLDTIDSTRPIVILSQNAHAAWMNSKAMELANISKETIDNETHRYQYMLDENGEPTGFMMEGAAFFPYFRTFGIGDIQTFKEAFERYLPTLSQFGITTLFDAGVTGLEKEAFEALVLLDKEGKLPLRFVGSFVLIDRKDDEGVAETFSLLASKYRSELFTVGAVKVMLDGENDDGGYFIHYTKDELARTLKRAMCQNINVMVHTTVDKSTHLALDAVESAKSSCPQSNSRITFAHINMVRDSDFKRFSDSNIIANIQPFNAKSGGFMEYRYVEYGEEWEHKLARYRNFYSHALTVSASSDFPACNGPMESCAPLPSMEMAITRKKPGESLDSEPLDSPDETLSLEQAIDAYTTGGACQLGMETLIGSLEVGKKADLVLLERKLSQLPVNQIGSTQVLLTMVNGKVVYLKGK